MPGDSHSTVHPLDDLVAEPGTRPSVDQAYGLWSETYDSVANPMLALEERYLRPMLPSLSGKIVLDLGCGTGRSLNWLASLGTGRYLGVDRSCAMLARAAKKLRAPGCLLLADCLELPLRSRSADVLICSFLLGYVNLPVMAAEIARVSKLGSDVFVSEFHPDTQSLGWKRSFRSGEQVIELPTNPCILRDVENTFLSHGFELVEMAEPGFGEPEREIFIAHKKSQAFDASGGSRAIFIHHWRRRNHAV
jgi:ubiquinone/menaquinone biosynthesis C-methylase UbiE